MVKNIKKTQINKKFKGVQQKNMDAYTVKLEIMFHTTSLYMNIQW